MSLDDHPMLSPHQRQQAEALHLSAKDRADTWADWHYLNTTNLAELETDGDLTHEGLASLTEAITNLDSEVFVRTLMAGETENEVLGYYQQFARAMFVRRMDQLLLCRTISMGAA